MTSTPAMNESHHVVLPRVHIDLPVLRQTKPVDPYVRNRRGPPKTVSRQVAAFIGTQLAPVSLRTIRESLDLSVHSVRHAVDCLVCDHLVMTHFRGRRLYVYATPTLRQRVASEQTGCEEVPAVLVPVATRSQPAVGSPKLMQLIGTLKRSVVA